MVDKGLSQNKVLYSSLEVELPIINYYAGSPAPLTLER